MSPNFSKHRVEALSDGIFAVAMTLLVLEIKVPAVVVPGALGSALRHDVAGWISFAFSFVLACVFWVLQHRVIDLVEEISTSTMVATFAALGFVALLPFSTSVLGHHIHEPLAFCVYFLNQMAIAAALTTKLELARRHGHLKPDVDLLRFRLYGTTVVMASAALAAALLPVNEIFLAPMLLGVAAKILRRRMKMKAAMG